MGSTKRGESSKATAKSSGKKTSKAVAPSPSSSSSSSSSSSGSSSSGSSSSGSDSDDSGDDSDSSGSSSSSSSSSSSTSSSGSSSSSSSGSSGSGSDSDSSDSSDSDSSDSSDSDSSDSDSDDDGQVKPSLPAKPAQPAALSSLFDPTSGGFSLGALASVEIDESVPVPTAPVAEVTADALVAAPKSTFDPDPEIPLFFSLPAREQRRGEAKSLLAPEPKPEAGEEGAEGYEGEDGYGAEEGAFKSHYQQQPSSTYQPPGDSTHPSRPWVKRQPVVVDPKETVAKAPKRFVADETDADMKKRWEQRRLELTQGWKRRHREAVKHRKRRGGEE